LSNAIEARQRLDSQKQENDLVQKVNDLNYLGFIHLFNEYLNLN